jgi:hypothetical protein
LFYADAFIANQNLQVALISSVKVSRLFPNYKITKVGLNLYTPIYQDLGVSAGASTIIAGRNIGKSTGFTVD